MSPENSKRSSRFKLPWGLIIVVLLVVIRIATRYPHGSSGASSVTPNPITSGSYVVLTTSQDGQIQADNECENAIHKSNGSESLADFRLHAAQTISVCSTAYQDGLKDAAVDSGPAHFMDENDAAIDEEMVAAALLATGDKIGYDRASGTAVTLANDVIANGHVPQLAASARETVKELVGPAANPSGRRR